MSCDPERRHLVRLGIEWGRTADELEDVLTPQALWEIVAVMDEDAQAIADARMNKAMTKGR